ncbi:MAG: DUF2779 domain-containing protein [Bacteroidetes bacterium]|nr:DUF2779 domain-containing protein [Bacteroidota bacterium]
MEKHILSKSTFMYGCQCPKRLYMHKHHKELRDPVPAGLQARFDMGTNVGELAQQLYPGGIDCTPDEFYDFRPSILRTSELIESGQTVIYEAAFQHEQVLAALDILVKNEDGWHAYEVKSTNDTKEQHVLDAALQYWVMTGSGLDLASISIIHFDREYVKVGELDIGQLFKADDITREVLELQDYVAGQVYAAKKVLATKRRPHIDIGPHCSDPYDCDFMGHCWQHVPDYSVFNLTGARGKQWELYHDDVLELKDIPDDFVLNASQQLQVDGEKTGASQMDKDGIRAFVDDLKYPLYYLDFESIQPAVPIYDQSRPYQQICFQYSLHVQQKPGGETEHFEFLADPASADPRRNLMEQMIPQLGSEGSIIVYHQSFESSRLKEMARDLPEFADAVQPIRERLLDLAIPFRKKRYYTPEMKGRWSIKNVLPALVPALSYSSLAIHDGGAASGTFVQMVLGAFDGDESQTRKHLLDYCELDTLAMVRLVEVLRELIIKD